MHKMPRYIDVKSLGIGKANREVFEDPKYADGWNAAIDILESAPAADVEEVRHEKWEPYLEHDDLRSNYYRCTGCKRIEEVPRGLSVKEWKPYCHCGAKMDLKEEEK